MNIHSSADYGQEAILSLAGMAAATAFAGLVIAGGIALGRWIIVYRRRHDR